MNERDLPARAFKDWWAQIEWEKRVKIDPETSPHATDSVIYAAFYVRCFPNKITFAGSDEIELIGDIFDTPFGPLDAVEEGEERFVGTDDDLRTLITQQIRARRGQKLFRLALIDRYGARCMVTGCPVVDVLEAAHIKAYRGAADHDPRNGLLLRADIHTLFDLDLLRVSPDLHVHLHRDIERSYRAVTSPKLLLPQSRVQPDTGALLARFRPF